MNYGFNKKIDDLEKRADEKLEQEVHAIYARYNYDVERLKAYASDLEIRTIMKLVWPRQIETFKGVWSIVGPDMLKGLFEVELYPLLYRQLLTGGHTRDDVLWPLEFHLDLLYDRLVHPELTKRFWEEATPPDPDIDPDGFDNHRISEECAALLKDAKRERDALKDQCFEKMKQTLRDEYEYEKETLRLDAIWKKEEEAKRNTI